MTTSLPLHGIRVLELAGLAPGPYAGMVLADFGADVVRVDRFGTHFSTDVLSRNKRSISVSLKAKEGVELLKTMLSAPPKGNKNKDLWRADVLIDPFRPGVLERLGLGPDVLLKSNPGLVIVRLTGFRREGPYSKMAGHDLNYIALSGVLSMLGRKDSKPYFPANILADFAGGGIMAVVGVLMALIERGRTGQGQVVETDMITGARYVSSFPLMMSRPSLGLPMWDLKRGDNWLDGGAPWYDVYETKDGGFMTLAALENHFYAEFLANLLPALDKGLIPSPEPTAKTQMDRSTWPDLAAFLTRAFRSKTRDEWTKLFLGTDSCCVPMLERYEVDAAGVGFDEPDSSLTDDEKAGDGGVPVAAPKLSRTPARGGEAYAEGEGFFLTPGKDTRAVLQEAGFGSELDQLVKQRAVELDEDDEPSKAKL